MSLESLYPFTKHTFDIDGHKLSYLDEGEGPFIVLLHGNPTWSFFYRDLILTLRADFRIIAPDHMGCGFSDKPQEYPYRLANHIDNLERLIDHLGIENHSLVVHDWGGAIGMGYAARHVGRIGALVILNTAAFFSPHIPFRIRICRTPLLGALMVRGFNLFAGCAISMATSKGLGKEVSAGYLQPYNSWANRVAVMRFIEDIPMHSGHPSWQTLLEAERAIGMLQDKPSLIVWGGKDFCFNDHFFNEWKKRLPHARVKYLEDAGHYLLEDGGEEALSEIKGFFNQYLHDKGADG